MNAHMTGGIVSITRSKCSGSRDRMPGCEVDSIGSVYKYAWIKRDCWKLRALRDQKRAGLRELPRLLFSSTLSLFCVSIIIIAIPFRRRTTPDILLRTATALVTQSYWVKSWGLRREKWAITLSFICCLFSSSFFVKLIISKKYFLTFYCMLAGN